MFTIYITFVILFIYGIQSSENLSGSNVLEINKENTFTYTSYPFESLIEVTKKFQTPIEEQEKANKQVVKTLVIGLQGEEESLNTTDIVEDIVKESVELRTANPLCKQGNITVDENDSEIQVCN